MTTLNLPSRISNHYRSQTAAPFASAADPRTQSNLHASTAAPPARFPHSKPFPTAPRGQGPAAPAAAALALSSRPGGGSLPMPLPFHATAGGAPGAHSALMHRQHQQHQQNYGAYGSQPYVRPQFVQVEAEGGFRAKAILAPSGPGGLPFQRPANYRVRTDLNDPELAQFPSKAGPKDWIKLPGQRGVPADEYQEFLDLGIGEIFDMDIDRVLDRDRKWLMPDVSRIGERGFLFVGVFSSPSRGLVYSIC